MSALEAASSSVSSSERMQSINGCSTPSQMAYTDKVEAWSKLGVDITPVISKPDGSGWDGKTGYVHDVAKTIGAISRREHGHPALWDEGHGGGLQGVGDGGGRRGGARARQLLRRGAGAV